MYTLELSGGSSELQYKDSTSQSEQMSKRSSSEPQAEHVMMLLLEIKTVQVILSREAA